MESNRRPSPYHACRFHPTTSYRVWLLQVRGVRVSEYVALCRPSAGVVVTYFVTFSRTSLRNTGSLVLPN
jgi:hypothetical protein